MAPSEDIPEGFQPYAEPSPFLNRIGPIYQIWNEAIPIFGLRILEHHCNRRQLAHGGLIVSLADIALGKTGEWTSDPPMSLLTASLTVDFLGAARLGDWIEAKSDLSHVGRRIAFANCYISAGDRRIARASGVFNAREAKS